MAHPPKDFRKQFHDLYLSLRTQMVDLVGQEPTPLELLSGMERMERTLHSGIEALRKQAQEEGYVTKDRVR